MSVFKDTDGKIKVAVQYAEVRREDLLFARDQAQKNLDDFDALVAAEEAAAAAEAPAAPAPAPVEAPAPAPAEQPAPAAPEAPAAPTNDAQAPAPAPVDQNLTAPVNDASADNTVAIS